MARMLAVITGEVVDYKSDYSEKAQKKYSRARILAPNKKAMIDVWDVPSFKEGENVTFAAEFYATKDGIVKAAYHGKVLIAPNGEITFLPPEETTVVPQTKGAAQMSPEA